MLNIEDSTHQYFTTNYYDQLKNMVTTALKYLDECPKATTNPDELLEENDANQRHRLKTQTIRIQDLQELIQRSRTEVLQKQPQSHVDRDTVENFRRKLSTQWDKITDLHEQIRVYEVEYSHEYFTENCFKNSDKYENILDELKRSLTSSTTTNSIQLPSIKLPTFAGCYDNWPTFYDLFQKIIHNNDSLAKAEKLQYLKIYLKGEASRIIQHL